MRHHHFHFFKRLFHTGCILLFAVALIAMIGATAQACGGCGKTVVVPPTPGPVVAPVAPTVALPQAPVFVPPPQVETVTQTATVMEAQTVYDQQTVTVPRTVYEQQTVDVPRTVMVPRTVQTTTLAAAPASAVCLTATSHHVGFLERLRLEHEAARAARLAERETLRRGAVGLGVGTVSCVSRLAIGICL